MKLPVIHVPISVKAATAFVTAAIVGGLGKLGVIDVDPAVLTWIGAGVGLLCSWAIPEGTRFVNYWLSKNGLPVDFEQQP